MLSSASPSPVVSETGPASPAPAPSAAWWHALSRRFPFVMLLVAVFASNIAGSVFNVLYNGLLIAGGILDKDQGDVFWRLALPLYNGVVYPICLAISVYLIWPLMRCRARLKARLKEGGAVSPGELERCRRRLVNLPFYQVCVNVLGWLPGAVFFPWIICALGGDNEAGLIWLQFGVSFLVSLLLTTVQTFFIIETYLVTFLYPDFFQDARPAEVRGALRISFGKRVVLLWLAVAVMPLVALLAVALNFMMPQANYQSLTLLAIGVAIVGALTGGFILWFLGGDLLGWVRRHAAATEQIAVENFAVRIPDKRPDEWGRLSDRFNDMASALQRAQHVRETFGQMVGPEVRDEVLDRYPGVGGEVQDVTVLFADIRGFSRRSAGQDPERVFDLLNRFFTLMAGAIERHRGSLDKFLGDGALALFGAPRPYEDHADRAVAAAMEIVARLHGLNAELEREGQEPLTIGMGLHTGPALVGCVGATLQVAGRVSYRREFTAIGETVNLSQRLEQLTKTCGGPILISGETRSRLRREVPVLPLGPQTLPGGGTLVVFRVVTADPACA